MPTNTTNISDVQQKILNFIKLQGEASNADLAGHLDVSYEAVRQQLRQLEAAQLIMSYKQRGEDARLGRPTQYYALSPLGDHFFPKAYDQLVISIIDSLAAALGPNALRELLTTLTDENVRQWAPHLQNKSLAEKLDALKGIYLEEDAYMEVDMDDASGALRLVERNCPFLNVASRRPALCSVTVSTLSRLLGCQVTREERFQDGDGRCVFHVHRDQPVDPEDFRFAFEEDATSA